MKSGSLKKVTGKMLKSWWEGLVLEQTGCCSLWFESTEKYRYCVCMGWQAGYGPASDEKWFGKDGKLHQSFCPPVDPRESDKGWRICWKIGRQTHNNIMQCDYDIDFEMPWLTKERCDILNSKLTAKERKNGMYYEGDVDDTEESIELKWGRVIEKGRNGHVEKMVLGAPVGYRSWEDLARTIRKTARRVWRDWKDWDD